jgi:histidine ammonia-lyase
MTESITLDGHSLTIEQLVRIARDVANYRRAWEAGEPAATEYGVTTGFGEFKDKPIASTDLDQLQRNIRRIRLGICQ